MSIMKCTTCDVPPATTLCRYVVAAWQCHMHRAPHPNLPKHPISLIPPPSDVQECPGGPADWQPEPPGFLARLLPSSNATGNATGSSPGGADEASQLRRFGLQVHGLWKVLCREVSG